MATTRGRPRHPGVRDALAAGITLTALVLASCGLPSQAASASTILSIHTGDSSSAVLVLTPPAGTVRIEIRRDGRPIDAFPVKDRESIAYTDHLLWPSTEFAYEVRGYDQAGKLIDTERMIVQTPAQQGSFPRLYAATSFWNQPIAQNASVDKGSAAMVARAIVPYSVAANFIAGSNEWGKPLAYASAGSSFPIGCTRYDCQTPVSFRIPQYARASTGSDHHLVVIDQSANSELDMWLAAAAWSAGSRYLTNPTGWGAVCPQGQHCGGAVAAGYDAFGGVVRPEEIAQGHIDHALFFTTPYTRSGFIACPATHTDGTANDANAIPEGARIQLDPAFNVDAQPWPAYEKVIAHALQTYGAYLGDTGGSISFPGEANINRGYDAWALAGVSASSQSLGNLPWSSFRVLQIQAC
jgi:hypothetical protein